MLNVKSAFKQKWQRNLLNNQKIFISFRIYTFCKFNGLLTREAFNHYFITFIDYFMKYRYVYLIKSKQNLLKSLNAINLLWNQKEKSIKIIDCYIADKCFLCESDGYCERTWHFPSKKCSLNYTKKLNWLKRKYDAYWYGKSNDFESKWPLIY